MSLDNITENLFPNPNLVSLKIRCNMSDAALISLSRFISKCNSLETCEVETKILHEGGEYLWDLADTTESDEFIINMLSPSKIRNLCLPLIFDGSDLRQLDPMFGIASIKSFSRLTIQADPALSLLTALRVMISTANRPLGTLDLNLAHCEDCQDLFKLSDFLGWLSEQSRCAVKGFRFSNLGLATFIELREFEAGDVRALCYGNLADLAVECRWLKHLSFYVYAFGEAELEFLEEVESRRAEKGMTMLDFEFVVDEMGKSLESLDFKRVWRHRKRITFRVDKERRVSDTQKTRLVNDFTKYLLKTFKGGYPPYKTEDL